MICCRVVHPLEILLELIFVHLNPHCLYNVSQFFADRGMVNILRVMTVNI